MDSQGQQLQQEPVKATGDGMSHSFGEGYSTRSDEEGFGGVYGGNQSISKPGEHENHPDYDKSQGSEVKQKEKGRNQAQSAKGT
ncbi:hypothetical protein T10_4463 [Trichinella papuae]|uniref:Uncharacterized protein n=1 Tax=Trichinella papuae TaxID=268474 RepID=A0A0V1LYK6_9BILA|nr:hypothetical protein T10_4463 [Trichinella papuae]